MLGHKDDLAGVIGVVANLAVSGLHDRVDFPPDRDFTLEIGVRERLKGVKDRLPSVIPNPHQLRPGFGRLDKLRERFKNLHVEGHRQYNPGWNLAIDLRNMLLVSECVARAALERTESRGGHTRDDHPGMDPNWRKTLLVCRAVEGNTDAADGPHISLTHEPQIPMRQDLLDVFDISELEKYYTDDELANHPGRSA